MSIRLHNRVAVVTGGADGIGLGAAGHLRSLGAEVVIADRDEERVRTAAGADGLHGVCCDVTDDGDMEDLKAASEALGEVAFVMANAGVAVGGRFEQIPVAEWQRLFDVNVFGVVRTINAFLPGMMERGDGTIVITGSSAGLFTGDGMNTPYAASKHALLALARSLAVYLRETGIAVHYLAPRLTDTRFPRSSVAWGRRGSRVTSDRDIGDDYDTVPQVVNALFQGIADGEFLISLTRDTRERLLAQLDNPPG